MRPVCSGCARPASVCLCDAIPAPAVSLRTRLLVLQHPHELKHKLATVPLLLRCLRPCRLVVGRRLHSANWPFGPSLGPVLLLFPALHATELESWHRERTHEAAASPRGTQALEGGGSDGGHDDQEDGAAEPLGEEIKGKGEITLVVVDGTWEHAQEMVKASLPFLSSFVTQVCLPFDVRSEGYGVGESDLIIRKEPFGGCMSTMEAVARALAILEPDGHVVESKLMDVLRKMVSLQASHFSAPKIRSKLKKKSKG